MILSLLQANPLIALFFITAIIAGITIHEFAHAAVAYRLGDPTAKLQGRLTLNPLAHLDPIGTLAILLIGIGFGKPTPFDQFNLRNIKRDSALIAVAGAVSNLLLALILSLPYLIAYYTGNLLPAFALYFQFISVVIFINLVLAIFNLIPIAPLDGFKVLAGFLPRDWYYDFMQTERYGIFILLFLVFFTPIIRLIVGSIVIPVFGILLPGLSVPLSF